MITIKSNKKPSELDSESIGKHIIIKVGKYINDTAIITELRHDYNHCLVTATITDYNDTVALFEGEFTFKN